MQTLIIKISLVDIKSVSSNVFTASWIIKLQDGGSMQEVGKGTSWLVPAGVNVDPTARAGGSKLDKSSVPG
ncbi:MAG: hypothetical protein LQ341_002620 [Variospora aurantia]|nr:MAG: hypothetical protein LQ341_002620 [Variospora aurantia]